jgi:hypothetical protein
VSGSSAVGSVRLVVGLAVIAAALLLTAGGGSAWATTGHTFVGQFGGAGDGDGQFGEPNAVGPAGVAVMPSTGEVYTVDAAQATGPPQPRVQRFSADGVFMSRFAINPSYEGGASGLAVDAGSGAVYVATGVNGGLFPTVVKYTAAGVEDHALNVGVSGTSINPSAQVAVDPVDGTVYVTVTDALGAQAIASFDPVSGLLVSSFDGSGTPAGFFCGLPTGLAVDGLQRVYVLDACGVERFSAGGAYETSLVVPPRADGSSETLSAVAVDPVANEAYVSHTGPVGTQVTHFSADGASVVYTFDAFEVRGVRAGVMAVSGAGTVYISDATRPFVAQYDRVEGPTVVTGSVPSPEARSAVLEGTIDPEGVESSYHFEYGFDGKYGSRTIGEISAGSGSDPVVASAAITGLKPNRPYHFRIVGSNASGTISGLDNTFTTATAPPDVDGSPPFVSAIAPRSARLHGTVNPNTNPVTQYRLEYGTTTAYGHTVNAVDPGGNVVCGFGFPCGGEDVSVTGSVSGLEPSTTYHFRVLAADNFNFDNPVQGADQTFVTAPAAGGGATGMSTRRATLTGTINPHGVATSYHFSYGPTTAYGARTAEIDAGSGDADQQVSREVAGLLPDTTYHVQVVATSSDGVVRNGADGLFRTAPAPTAEVTGPTGVSTDAATLAGEVHTFGLAGSYHFDIWSLDSGYASSTPERPASGNASAERVSAAVSGLPAGETYVVQLAVTSNDSVGVSDMLTFATAPVPRVFAPPPGADVYGCASPRLDAFGGRPKPGQTITVSGQDLGVGGNVVLGDRSPKPVAWSATGFKVLVPEDAAGTLALTVNCGRLSNTIAVAVFDEPDSRFAVVVGRLVAGSAATLRVRVPGPGKIESSGANSRAAKVTIKKAGTATIKVKLSSAGVKALGRASSRTLRIKARVRFTPAGGRSASKTVTITFKRGGGR